MSSKETDRSDKVYQVEKLHKRYGTSVVLRDVSFELASGAMTAIMGPSGSGKSTLLHCLGGVDKADSGSILFHGKNMMCMPAHEIAELRRAQIASIFQFFYLLPTLTVEENIAFPLQLQSMPSRQRKERVATILSQVGMEERKDAFPNQLSGGEQQRAAIARALITRPKVILADEPTGNLDSQNGRRILDLMRELLCPQNIALLLVTHSEEAAAICHRTWKMQDGNLIT
ncbi:MAG: ABC transporter ATP-binding protein [Verrucomicrobiae bacterium]|nr:ABC transporter ATP-binding protein [Verrucomicrobiae bacterium]